KPVQAGRRDFIDAVGEVEEEFLFRVDVEKFQQFLEVLGQVIVGQAVCANGQEQRGQALAQLDGHDEIQRGRPLGRGGGNDHYPQILVFWFFTHQRTLDSKKSRSSEIFRRSCRPSSR